MGDLLIDLDVVAVGALLVALYFAFRFERRTYVQERTRANPQALALPVLSDSAPPGAEALQPERPKSLSLWKLKTK